MSQETLNVTKKSLGRANELELSVEAPLEISQKAYINSLQNASNSVEVPGFRKGKAPREIVEKKIGKEYISQKAFENIFYSILSQVAIQEKLDIVDIIQIDSYELIPDKPLKFKVLIELRPEIKLGKYKGLKVKAKKHVYDKNLFIEKTLERVANNLITFKSVSDRCVNPGDLVIIDFEGKFEDGTLVPGGKVKDFQAILEKDKFLPEFVEKLAGAKTGEMREVFITFPENYSQGFSGKKAIFNVTVKSIEEKIVPKIDDELAKKVGEESLEKLKEKIELQMLEVQNKNSKIDLENKAIDEIVKSSEFQISERMVQKEIDFLLKDTRDKYQKDGNDWEGFKSDLKNKELLEKAKESAIRRISIDLILNAIIKKEEIAVSDDEIHAEIKNQINRLGKEYSNLETNSRFRNTVELNILRNKAIDFLLEHNEPVWEEEKVKITE